MKEYNDDEIICPVCNNIIDNDYDICEYCLNNKIDKTINVFEKLVPKTLNFKSGADKHGKN